MEINGYRVVISAVLLSFVLFSYEIGELKHYTVSALRDNEKRANGVMLWNRTSVNEKRMWERWGSSLSYGNASSEANGQGKRLNSYEKHLLKMEGLRDEFLEQLKTRQQLPIDSDPSPNGYVIYYPIKAGLGNSVQSIAEAVLVSILTGRQFYMYDYQIFDQYFDLPYKYHQYPNSSFLTKDSMIIEGVCTVLPSVILSSSKEFIIFRSTCRILDYVVFNEQFSSFLRGHGFVIKEQYTADEVKKVLRYFLYHKVIAVKQFVWDEVNRVKNETNWDNYRILGLQIRTARMPKDVPGFFIQREDVKYFEARANELTAEWESKQAKQSKQFKPVRWFVACDNSQEKELLRIRNSKRVLNTRCTITHSSTDMHRSERTKGMMCTLVDNLLLSYADYALVTVKSTYGVLALARNYDMPREVVRYGAWNAYRKKRRGY